MNIDLDLVPTPCYVVDQSLIRKNLVVLDHVQKQADCKILLALKGFAMFSLFPLIRKVLYGTAASSADEARLGYEEFGKEVHTCAPGYPPGQFGDIIRYSDHIIFNSLSQWNRLRPTLENSNKSLECGIRLNPEYSEIETEIYNPCCHFSRLGVTITELEKGKMDGLHGLHFHTHCEQNSDALERTLEQIKQKFDRYLGQVKWVNFGGGHHITRPDYDVDRLCQLIIQFRDQYKVDIYLEPGEAIALNTGFLVTSVLDIIHNKKEIAVLDVSASAHMPDVLEMPYRPALAGAGMPGQNRYTVRLAGPTCLAGDVIGDYSFSTPLRVGTKLVFTDMAHYTMVKNTTFNGVRLPSIAICDSETDEFRLVKTFGFEDYRNRLS